MEKTKTEPKQVSLALFIVGLVAAVSLGLSISNLTGMALFPFRWIKKTPSVPSLVTPPNHAPYLEEPKTLQENQTGQEGQIEEEECIESDMLKLEILNEDRHFQQGYAPKIVVEVEGKYVCFEDGTCKGFPKPEDEEELARRLGLAYKNGIHAGTPEEMYCDPIIVKEGANGYTWVSRCFIPMYGDGDFMNAAGIIELHPVYTWEGTTYCGLNKRFYGLNMLSRKDFSKLIQRNLLVVQANPDQPCNRACRNFKALCLLTLVIPNDRASYFGDCEKTYGDYKAQCVCMKMI